MSAKLPAVTRFWSQVKKQADGCWLWTGQIRQDGYGQIALYEPGKRVRVGAHRFSYALHFGDVPPDLLVCHKCDVRRCVRPDHLFLGSAADNAADMVNKGRQATGDKHGSRTHPERLLGRSQKLSVADAKAIFVSGERTNDLAERYGVNRHTISNIRRGRFWSHATTEASCR